MEEVAGAAEQAVSARGRFVYSARAWLAAVCASELGRLLVFWLLGVVALLGPLTVRFKEFTRRPRQV